jgi:hypothetical protein
MFPHSTLLRHCYVYSIQFCALEYSGIGYCVVLWLRSNGRNANNLMQDFQSQVFAVESIEERIEGSLWKSLYSLDLFGSVLRSAAHSLAVYVVTLRSLYYHF